MAEKDKPRIVVITAGASRMGREAALRFAAAGDHVVSIDVAAEANASLVEEIEAAGGHAEALGVDMGDLGAIAAATAEIGSRHGRIDVLWNHVGAPGPRGFEFEPEEWHLNVGLNLAAPIFMTKGCWSLLKQAQDGATVLFTSSVSGLVASRNSPIYSALKSGVIGYMRAVAAIGGPEGIRANALCPGVVETPMLRRFFGEADESDEVIEERLQAYYASVPAGRGCTPEEVGELAVFLASPAAAYISGTAIPIDGGYVAV